MSFDFGSAKGRKEPTADLRLFADINRQMYQAHVDEGFSPREALELTKIFLRESIRANLGGDGKSDD